jgi:hypothetical protein
MHGSPLEEFISAIKLEEKHRVIAGKLGDRQLYALAELHPGVTKVHQGKRECYVAPKSARAAHAGAYTGLRIVGWGSVPGRLGGASRKVQQPNCFVDWANDVQDGPSDGVRHSVAPLL